MKLLLQSLLCFTFAVAAFSAPEKDEIAVLLDFSGKTAGPLKPYRSWRWKGEVKAHPKRYTAQEYAADPERPGKTVWHVTIKPEFPWDSNPERFTLVTGDHFPPDAGAVVMEMKIVSGEICIAFGNPVAYFGDSDVMTSPQLLTPGGWNDVYFDLDSKLCRNFRRAGLGGKASAITYNRWSQEPPGIYLLPSKGGEFMMRNIRIVRTGRGAKFPVFSDSEIETLAKSPMDENDFFSFYAPQYKEQIADFYRAREGYAKQFSAIVMKTQKDENGGNVFEAEARWSEEMRWAGVKLDSPASADAVKIKMKLRTSIPNSVSGEPADGAVQPVDIQLFAGPPDTGFPFAALSYPDPGGKIPAMRGFDYMAPASIQWQKPPVPFALFHARRFVRAGEWTELVIPFDDFVCTGATGEFSDVIIARGQPDTARMKISAAGMLMPVARKRGKEDRSSIFISALEFVKIKDRTAKRLYSYPRPVKGTLTEVPGMTAYGHWKQCDAENK